MEWNTDVQTGYLQPHWAGGRRVPVAITKTWTTDSGDTRHHVVLMVPLDDLPTGALIQGAYSAVTADTFKYYGVQPEVFPV